MPSTGDVLTCIACVISGQLADGYAALERPANDLVVDVGDVLRT